MGATSHGGGIVCIPGHGLRHPWSVNDRVYFGEMPRFVWTNEMDDLDFVAKPF